MNSENNIKISSPRSLDHLLDDPDVRAGYEEARAAREAARVIEWWRDHDLVTGGPISNRELAGRLDVSPQRITALTKAASAKKPSGFGPSYAMLRRICRAAGYPWPAGLVEALTALTSEALVARIEARPGPRRESLEVTIETGDHRVFEGRIPQKGAET